MKNSILLTSFIFLLLGFSLNSNVLATDNDFSGIGFSKENSTSSEASALVCYTPTGLYTSYITETAAMFNWEAVSGALNYSVQIRLPGGAWSYIPGSPFQNSPATVNNLDPGTTYEWRVKANCYGGESSYWSAPVSFTTEGSSTCEVPWGLNTYNITQTTATWDWSPAGGAISYSVQWRYAGGTWNDLAGGPFTVTLLNIGGLQPGTTYEWRVRSNCYSGVVSAWSAAESFTTLGESCSTPTGLYTSYITETAAMFNWSPVSGAESYSVQIRVPGGAWSYIPGSPFDNSPATVNYLNACTTYEWRVKANCGYNNESYWSSAVSFTTLCNNCAIPTGLYTSYITETAAMFNWASVPGAQSYSVQIRVPGGAWSYIPGSPFDNSPATVNYLNACTTYEWRVKANCGYNNESYWSSPVSFTTLCNTCDVPSGLYTSYITETAAMFNWAPVSGAQSYSVQIRLPGGTWSYISGSPFYNSPATINYLTPCTTYEWRVRANCSYNNVSYWSSPVSFTTLCNTCDVPSGLYTSYITQTAAMFNWAPVSGAQNYSVQIRVPGGAWSYISGSPFQNSPATINYLNACTTYEWRVKANCSYNNESYWSSPVSFTTLCNTCDVPSGLYTSYITETAAMFNWAPVSGAQSYSVQIRLPGGAWSYISGSPFYNSPATINYLNACTTYEWRVKANCSYNNESYWSSPVSFTTLCNTCDVPSGLYTSYITETAAMFNWAPVSGAQSYSVQIRLPGGAWSYISGSPFYNSPATINYLTPCTTYEWRVKANCGYNNASLWSSPISFTTLCNTCDTPGGLYTSYVTENAAMFNWAPVSGAQSYEVQIRVPGGGVWNYIAGSPFFNSPATVSNLFPGTTYEWRIRTNCGSGNFSYWSHSIVFTTAGSYDCNPPGWLNTYNITQTTATWDWESVSGAISYSVQWRYPGGTWNNLQGGPWSHSILNVAGLQPGTTYEWRVKSNCPGGVMSDWSIATSFTTLGSTCSIPTGLYTTNITESSATFNWSPVSGAQSYSVQIRLPWGSWSYISGSPFNGTSAIVYNLSPGTTYEWRVRANCGYGYHSYWSAPLSFTTSGSSSCVAPVGLNTYNITATTATWDWEPVSGAVSYSVQWRFAGGTWYNLPGGPWSGTALNIGGLQPETAYEWRVRSNCSNGSVSAWSAAAAFSTLGSSCAMPIGLITTDITESSAVFHWDSVANAVSYSVQLRLPYGSWEFIPGSPFTDTTATVTNLSAGTAYEWRVRANCNGGGTSNWTPAVSFITTGTGSITDNDECIEATLLTVGSDCNYTSATNVGATPSTPSPMGWCPTNWYKDVWFKFTMPNVMNPTVTIRTTAGTLTDGVMEVYSGDCSSLTFLTCEDDNYNGNGSTMPVINLTGSPGSAVWVRVWGYGGTTGTFNICVFDYQSNNYADDEEVAIPITGDIIDQVKSDDAPDSKDVAPSYTVSPNPASDLLQVSYMQTEESTVTALVIMDISGQVVMKNDYDSRDTKEFREQLDVSGLTPGMYVLRIVTTSGILSEKVTVVK